MPWDMERACGGSVHCFCDFFLWIFFPLSFLFVSLQTALFRNYNEWNARLFDGVRVFDAVIPFTKWTFCFAVYIVTALNKGGGGGARAGKEE